MDNFRCIMFWVFASYTLNQGNGRGMRGKQVDTGIVYDSNPNERYMVVDVVVVVVVVVGLFFLFPYALTYKTFYRKKAHINNNKTKQNRTEQDRTRTRTNSQPNLQLAANRPDQTNLAKSTSLPMHHRVQTCKVPPGKQATPCSHECGLTLSQPRKQTKGQSPRKGLQQKPTREKEERGRGTRSRPDSTKTNAPMQQTYRTLS
ncbi:hypothetical protein F5B18DRAFT_493402 [Nemania serpens]|nr:hypothetical protein F5B18DRAFT_493402 [Nemania serpens]